MSSSANRLNRLLKRKAKNSENNPEDNFYFGRLAFVEDKKVHFIGDERTRDYFHIGFRPGVVIETEMKDRSFEVSWVPGSTKLENRDTVTTVCLSPHDDSVQKETVLLISHLQSFIPLTLSLTGKRISPKKQDELKLKVNKYKESRS